MLIDEAASLAAATILAEVECLAASIAAFSASSSSLFFRAASSASSY